VHVASVQRMLSVIKPDQRLPCPVRTFPYAAMGQIKAKASDGGFVCSGGLIGPNRVLTAGHCVWDDRGSRGPFRDLRFAPGQWRDARGRVGSLFGAVDWDYVTLFDAYINDPDGEGLPYDVAVITLHKPVGSELGWLGIKADAPPCRPTPLTLTLAGYPGEDPDNPRPGGWSGGCFYDRCSVSHSCAASITNHTCDSYVGQSGAPMFDSSYFVRAVHTLGVLPGFSTANGAITIQRFMLDNVMGYWKDTDGWQKTDKAALGR
jgi:V8-like Glu-specific endopeptidase